MKNITAQELSRWNKFRDKTNISRRINEGISSSYQEEMDKLREVDDEIRLAAIDLKPNLSSATAALKQRRYLDLFHFADEINKILSKITENLKKISDSRDRHINEFYGESEYYDPSKEFSFASVESQMLKEAGVFSSIFGSERERAARALEKMYKKKIQKQKLAMNKLSKNLNIIVSSTIASLKQMAGFRTSGKLSDYIESLEKIELSRKRLSEELKLLYNTYIKDIVAYKKEHGKIEEETESAEPKRKIKPAEQAAQEIIEFENALPSPQEGQYYPDPEEAEKDEAFMKELGLNNKDQDGDGDIDATDETIKEYEQKSEPRKITKEDRARLTPNNPPTGWTGYEWTLFLRDLDQALLPNWKIKPPWTQAEWDKIAEQLRHGETDLWREYYGYKKLP